MLACRHALSGDHAAQVAKIEFATLAGHNLYAGVTQQSPMKHGIEDVFARHADLLAYLMHAPKE